MSWVDEHIASLEVAIKGWLSEPDSGLTEAVKKTVDEGIFPIHDIEFQLGVFSNNLNNGDIRAWADRSGISNSNNAKEKKILCLHAGNLPLVGFQDAIATILSGADYFGKISRKDPYLLSSFLTYAQLNGVSQIKDWSTDIGHFENLGADHVLFAGSELSIDDVKEKINMLKAISKGGDYLVRTAKFSIAYLDSKETKEIRHLVEAMLRYKGRGCRSVAMVVSPFSLSDLKAPLQEEVRLFLKENPTNNQAQNILNYQKAYNKAVGRSQLDMGSVLIHESDDFPELEGVIHWVHGDEDTLNRLRAQFGRMVQSVYSNTKGGKYEYIRDAQWPNLWWEPDGIDIISELLD